MEENPFDMVHNLEEQYYNEGYALGVADGTRAGHLEGRFFGFEKGLEKFVELGKLRGRSIIWSNRVSSLIQASKNTTQDLPLPNSQNREREPVSKAKNATEEGRPMDLILSAFSPNLRIERHLQNLHALSEPESLDTHNSEDAVSEFDDRLKRARAKTRIIEKLVGEEVTSTGRLPQDIEAAVNIEDAGILGARR